MACIPAGFAGRIVAVTLLSFALFEGISVLTLLALDIREGQSFYSAARNRYATLRQAWVPPNYYGSFDPLVQMRHIPGSMYRGLLVNEHGFIGNGNDDPALASFPEKPIGVYRILLLGGSSVAGDGVSDARETISSQLERQLNATTGDSGLRYQVLNFGLRGGYTGSEVLKFLMQLVHLQPDMVISLDGFNDAWNAVFEHTRVGLPHGILNWGDYNYLYFERLNGLVPHRGTARSPKVLTFSVTLANRLLISHWQPAARRNLYAEYPWYVISGQLSQSDKFFAKALGSNLNALGAYATMNPEVALIAYLQPHAHQWKPLTAGERERLEAWHTGRFTWDTYRGLMLPAFERYAEVYRSLAEQYSDIENVDFINLLRLFEEEHGDVYADVIHYTAHGNGLLAGRMAKDIARLRSDQQRSLAVR